MKALARILAAITVGTAACFAAEKPLFRHVDVDTKVQIGYGLAVADVNGDKLPDIVLADKNIIVWYENPNWTKHVIAEKLTELDHVCIAARDIDGDGKAEIAAGAGWNPGDTVNSGAVFYLKPGADRRQKWTPIKLQHEPTVHRMRWVKTGAQEFKLVVAPLHGRGNRNGLGAPVHQLAYTPPADVTQEWKTEIVDQSMHITHNLDPVQWDADPAEEILLGGREALLLIDRKSDGAWGSTALAKNSQGGFMGAGEVRAGKLQGRRMVATVEQFHGTNLCVYVEPEGGAKPDQMWPRRLIASNLAEGHALACADILGTGSDQIVVGWRNKNAEGNFGITLYEALDKNGQTWKAYTVDKNLMACEDLAVADFDGNGKLDIVAAGRSTKNLKIYFNE